MIFSPSADGENATVLIIEQSVDTVAAMDKSLAHSNKFYTGDKH